MKKRFNNSLTHSCARWPLSLSLSLAEKGIEKPRGEEREKLLAPRGAAELISTIQY
jgi:hypothetical protein